MEDVKAMVAVSSSDLMKTVLSKLSVRSHAQQFVIHMGRDCTRTMAVRLNEGGLRYEDNREIYDKCKPDEASFHANLLEAGITRRPWHSKLWLHFSKKQCSS